MLLRMELSLSAWLVRSPGAVFRENQEGTAPKFSISIFVPSMKFSGPCSIMTTQQKVAIVKKTSQSKKRT